MDRLTWTDLGARPAFFPALWLAAGAWLLGRSTGAAGSAFLIVAASLCALAIALRGRSGALLALLVGSFLAGGGLAALRFDRGAAAPAAERAIDAVVEDVRRSRDTGAQVLTVALLPPLEGRAILHARGEGPQLLAGQRIRTFAKLSPLSGPDNPGEADFADPRWRDGIAYRGSYDPSRLAALSDAPAWRQWLTAEHAELSDRTRRAATSDRASALFLTLAAGARAELGEELEDAFSRSGLAHILSVSGLHVAMLALILLGAARFLLVWRVEKARAVDARRFAAPLALPFVWAYVLYTGWQPPAVRSAVMASVALIGLTVWRRGDGLNAVSLALLVVVAIWPAAVADLSVQLSFLAVFSLVLLTPAIRASVPIPPPPRGDDRGVRDRLRRAAEACLRTFCASLAVTLASLPLVLHAFGRMSVAGLLSNIVSLPVAGALTALTAGGAAVFTMSRAAAEPVLWLGCVFSELLIAIAELFARLPFASVELPPPGAIVTVTWSLGLLAFALGRGRLRWCALLSPVALVALPVLPAVAGSGMEVTFLAVGQGDAIVVSSGGKHALIDGGGVPRGGDVGARVVRPYLRSRGVRSLELAVLSHPHPDHALGLISTLGHVNAAQVWIPARSSSGQLIDELTLAKGTRKVAEVDAATAAFQLGEARIEVLGPPSDDVLLEGVNDRSVVLRVVHGDVVVLLTGDIESAGEELLNPGRVTVMKAPHHGSRTSSSEPFIAKTRPRIAIFCVGRRNRFGFPHEDVVDRYAAVGAECFRTDLDGAVTVKSDGHDVRVTTWHPREQAGEHTLSGDHVAAAAVRPQPSGDDP